MKKQLFACFFAGCILASGCITLKRVPPQWMSPDFPALSRVALLPVADLREKKETVFTIGGYTGRDLKRQLRILKYQVDVIKAPPEKYAALTPTRLPDPGRDWIESLAAPENRYLFLPVLTQFETKGALGLYTEMQLSGYLYDRQTGQLLWRHTGSGEDAGSLLHEQLAADATTFDLIRGFPKKK